MAKVISRYILGILFTLAGIFHFVEPERYLKIMPPYIPEPLLMVYLSGVAEAVFGLMVLIPATTKIGAWGLIATLIAVFPANLHMALYAQDYPQLPEVALWVRLPIQALLIWWAWKHTK